MKQVLIAIIVLLLSLATFAQRPVVEQLRIPANAQGKAPTDTLWPGNAATASNYVLLADSNGGYVLGTNSYNSIAIGQQFKVSLGYRIEGAFYWIGAKKADANDSITFSVWRMDSLQGYTMTGANQPSPGTVTTSLKTTTQQLDTASTLDGAFLVTFPLAITVMDDYVIGVDFSEFTTDSIGLMSTDNGDGGGLELVWEQWGINNSWHTLQASGWGFPALLDIDAMILPIVDMSTAGRSNSPELNGLSCTLWPNPAHEVMHLVITSNTTFANCSIQLFDLNGKLLLAQNTTGLSGNSQTVDISLDQLAAGYYYCVVAADGARYAMKVAVD